MSKVKKYKKKPVIIEAVRWEWQNWEAIKQFVPVPDILYVPREERNKDNPSLRIKTLEGEHIVNYGDYIVKGIKGEYYPVKPDIFWETYEEV